MSRCAICDHSSDIDAPRPMKWSNKEGGYVCSSCSDAIFAASYQQKSANQYVFGEEPTLDVEGLELLEFSGVEVDLKEIGEDKPALTSASE